MSRNVGREDRLVRAGVALSLLMIGGFVVVASGGFGPATTGFALLAGHFVLTAAVGWDPIYARLQMDTQPQEAQAPWDAPWVPDTAHAAMSHPSPPLEIDLREPRMARGGHAGGVSDS